MPGFGEPGYQAPVFDAPAHGAPSYPPPPPGFGTPGYGSAGYGMPGYPTAASSTAGYGTAGYGTSGYGAPEYGSAGYGAPGYGAPGYGAPEYGTPGYAPPPGYGPQPYWGYPGFAPRPSGATVITGAVVQIVQGALALLVGLLLVFAADVIRNSANDLDSQGGFDSVATREATAGLMAVGIVIVLFAVFFIVLAALAIRRHRWAVLTSVVLQVVGIVLLVAGMATDSQSIGGNLIALLMGLAVVVLFLVPATNRYLSAP